MKRVMAAADVQQVERVAGESFGMPASLLMENAGGELAREALRLASASGRFFVVCGRGNNGGDGLVAARKLAAAGRLVQVEVLGGTAGLKGDPLRNLEALTTVGLVPAPIEAGTPVGPGDVVIDAVFGTGLNRAPEGIHAKAIRRMESWRAAGAKVVAVDVPSGLETDSGRPFEPCVRADLTVSFGFLKLAHVLEPGASLSGCTLVVDIGMPTPEDAGVVGPGVFLVEEADARSRLPRREANTHKGSFGHVLVVAGSRGKTGAAALAALAVLRSGAGLVTVATRPDALSSAQAHAPELMGVELPGEGPLGPGDLDALRAAAEGKDALVVGPGIPRGEGTAALLGALLQELHVPFVIDADGLNALVGHLELLKTAKAPVILTPHPGEMARLSGKSTQQVQQERLQTARELALATGAHVVLKGSRTLIALPDGRVWINPTGNPGMATGGTGDVLAGLCGALLAQGLSAEDAALTGVFAHGLAGDLAVKHTGRLGLIASDLLPGLQQVWLRWDR
ncbi:MAG TPA: NAD(P)H-hydrate dehydratase [Longimicrobium sp.]|nr:NAD(P)H-hydrate dehydratase [Longimicrobium sp.]